MVLASEVSVQCDCEGQCRGIQLDRRWHARNEADCYSIAGNGTSTVTIGASISTPCLDLALSRRPALHQSADQRSHAF